MPRLICSLCSVFIIGVLAAPYLSAEFRPSVPLLELKKTDNEWTWYRGDEKFDATDESVATLWKEFAKYSDKKTGWKGLDENGNSDNLAVIHVDALAPSAYLHEVLNPAADYRVHDFAIAITQHIGKKPDRKKAPNTDELDKAYKVAKGERDEGIARAPRVPKEQITVYTNYDPASLVNGFVVAIDARGRKPVDNSYAKTEQVILKKEMNAEQKQEVERTRKQVVDNVAALMERYIVNSGANVEVVEVSAGLQALEPRKDDSPPWVFVEMAWLAAKQVNAKREDNGKKALTILLPFQYTIAEPPPPEQPPERPVEYPKDDPGEQKPTEGERIIPESERKKDKDSSK